MTEKGWDRLAVVFNHVWEAIKWVAWVGFAVGVINGVAMLFERFFTMEPDHAIRTVLTGVVAVLLAERWKKEK